MTFKLQKKSDPDDIKEKQQRVSKVIKNLSQLSADPSVDFLDTQVQKLVDENFGDIVE